MMVSLRACSLLSIALLAVSACGREDVELVGGGDGGPGGPIPGLVSIEVSPPATTITIDDLTATHTVDFTATGRFEGGDTRDITSLVAWGVDNPAPGDFTGGARWQSSNRAGGRVTVEARAGAVWGTAELTVVLRPILNDSAFPPPPGAEGFFDPAYPVTVGGPRAPVIAYPAHEVKFPTNLYRVLFQHNPGTGTDLYRIRFQSPFLDMQVFTTGDRWQADETTWSFLALTNAGARVVMTVAGVDTAGPGTVYESSPIDIYFSRSAVEGAIYYWSTSSEGIMKGVISQPAPTKFYTQPPSTTCVACHTVSRDGRRMAVGYDGEELQEIGVPARNVLIPAGQHAMGWSTFSPDGRLLLVANKGTLTLLDADTGSPVGPNGGVIAQAAGATHPDWSPAGDYVAVAACTDASKNKDVTGCSIARLPYNGGSWGPLEILVPASVMEENHFFPKYSPDGRWIVYVTAIGKSKDQPTARLSLVPAGGGTPTTLARANERVGPLDGVIGIGNTMPTWAPTTHPGTQWIAFSSVRDYGKILVGDKADQLWVVALDLEAIPGDPSFAAFWLPLQDVTERNHRAFWAHDAEVPCDGVVEVCDGYDNDCDGVIDEMCTPCADDEVCFDGVDNDCDGVIDDGCIG